MVGSDGAIELRMEAALILAEYERNEVVDLLAEVARNPSNPSELRAAGAWGIAGYPRNIRRTPLLELLAVDDDLTAVHAIVAASRLLSDDSLDHALDLLGANERQSAGIIRAIAASRCNPVERISSPGSGQPLQKPDLGCSTCLPRWVGTFANHAFVRWHPKCSPSLSSSGRSTRRTGPSGWMWRSRSTS